MHAKSFLIFRNLLLKIGRPMQNSIYNIHDPVGIKYLTRLRLGLSHLNEHKFRHNFQDYLNPLCSCIVLRSRQLTIISRIAIVITAFVRHS